MKRKKITALMMAMAVMATTLPVSAFAETTGGGTTELTEADLTDNKKEVAIPVTSSVNASFSVKLPASIELTKTETGYGYTGTVGVKGVIGAGKAVTVTPKKNGKELTSITMYDVTNRPTEDLPASSSDESGYDHYSSVSATVTQDMIGWKKDVLAKTSAADGYTYADGYQMAPLTLSTPDLKPAEWAGTLNYEIAYASDTVDDDAFNKNKLKQILGVSDLTGDVVIPETYKSRGMTYQVTKIRETGFYGSGITGITIPNSVKNIGNTAFSGCTSLSSVTLPASLTYIGASTFSGCTSLSSVTLPTSIKQIANDVFGNCTSLTEITYSGTQEQWNAITKHKDWNKNSSITTVHCSDGNITL